MQPNMNKNWNNDKASAFSHVFAGICSLFFFGGGGFRGFVFVSPMHAPTKLTMHQRNSIAKNAETMTTKDIIFSLLRIVLFYLFLSIFANCFFFGLLCFLCLTVSTLLHPKLQSSIECKVLVASTVTLKSGEMSLRNSKCSTTCHLSHVPSMLPMLITSNKHEKQCKRCKTRDVKKVTQLDQWHGPWPVPAATFAILGSRIRFPAEPRKIWIPHHDWVQQPLQDWDHVARRGSGEDDLVID